MTNTRTVLFSLAALLLINSLGGVRIEMALAGSAPEAGIVKQPFGTTPQGDRVDLYTLTNRNGMQVTISTFGAAVTTLKVPDRNGQWKDVVLGYDDLQGYLADTAYFGATVGRYAGRVAKGQFAIDGTKYQLSINNGSNHLHGGKRGLNKVVWNRAVQSSEHGSVLLLTYSSRDGDEGYPGNLECMANYLLTDANELKIYYRATTDKPTIVNFTHHGYFNLAGYDAGDILGHELTVFANYYAPAEPEWLIPTGEIRSVNGTALDFTKPTVIGTRLTKAPADLGGNNEGYDLNYALSNGGRPTLAARLYEPKSGRVMEVFTTEPALQVYTSNFLDGTIKGKGVTYQKYAAICLEPEHFPNSPNIGHFPSVVLRPNAVYRHTVTYKFSTK